MKPTVSYIQTRFDDFNACFFNRQLPPVPIKLSNAKSFLGKLTFTRCRHGLFGRYRNENFVLRINTRIDLPESLIEDTILHEMIHYYIAVNQLHDTSTHGLLFRREMKRINAEGKRHITVSHRLTDAQRAQTIVHKTRTVAIIRFADGRMGVKVVPSQQKHINFWHKAAMRRFPITSIQWIQSDNDFFARFPSSIAMKIYLVQDPSVLPPIISSSL